MASTRGRASGGEIGHGERLGEPRAIGAGMTSTLVETREGPALLVQLVDGMLDESLGAREEAARAMAEVLTSTRAGRARSRAVEASAYRGDLAGGDERDAALFPVRRAVTLAPALARARAGERAPLGAVVALVAGLARGMEAAEGLLTPTSILVDPQGGARVRGPVLEAIVAAIRGESDAPRWTSYFAPEQIQGGGTPREARRFALGVMALELATGHAVFPAGAAAVAAIAAWQPKTSALAGIAGQAGSGELRSVLWSWVQRDPHRRIEPDRVAGMLEPFADPGAVASVLGVGAGEAPYFLP